MRSLSPTDAERLRLAFQRCRDMEGTLNQQLQAYADAGREIFPAYGEAVDRLVARLNQNGGGENAPHPGEAMPDFVLPNENGRLVTLPSLLAQGPVAVMFFRGHWCPYCRININTLARAQRELVTESQPSAAMISPGCYAAHISGDQGSGCPAQITGPAKCRGTALAFGLPMGSARDGRDRRASRHAR